MPFSSFQPVNPQDPPLDPFLVHTLTIRFEPKRQVSALCCTNFHHHHKTASAALAVTLKWWLSNWHFLQRPGDGSQNASDPRNFELKLEYIKALPVSCSHIVPVDITFLSHVLTSIALFFFFFCRLVKKQTSYWCHVQVLELNLTEENKFSKPRRFYFV